MGNEGKDVTVGEMFNASAVTFPHVPGGVYY